MSTRCNIIVCCNDGTTHQFYHHCDGYPEGVGVELCDAFSDAMKSREGDEAIDHMSVMQKLSEDNRSYEYEGEVMSPHGDIEFLYTIESIEDGIRITCFQYDEINDWEKVDYPNYKPLCLKREICTWTFPTKSWRTWREEGRKKLSEQLSSIAVHEN